MRGQHAEDTARLPGPRSHPGHLLHQGDGPPPLWPRRGGRPPPRLGRVRVGAVQRRLRRHHRAQRVPLRRGRQGRQNLLVLRANTRNRPGAGRAAGRAVHRGAAGRQDRSPDPRPQARSGHAAAGDGPCRKHGGRAGRGPRRGPVETVVEGGGQHLRGHVRLAPVPAAGRGGRPSCDRHARHRHHRAVCPGVPFELRLRERRADAQLREVGAPRAGAHQTPMARRHGDRPWRADAVDETQRPCRTGASVPSDDEGDQRPAVSHRRGDEERLRGGAGRVSATSRGQPDNPLGPALGQGARRQRVHRRAAARRECGRDWPPATRGEEWTSCG